MVIQEIYPPPPPDIVFVCFSDLVKPSNNWNKKFGFSPTKRYNTVKGKLVCKKKIETIFKLALNYTNFLLYINLYIKPFFDWLILFVDKSNFFIGFVIKLFETNILF